MGEKKIKSYRGKSYATHKGVVFIYVLFSVALFMLLFSTLIFALHRNLDFMTKAFVENKLYNDGTSTTQKVIGLFQSNPTTDAVYASTQKRDVVIQAFDPAVEGYVYKNKSDVVIVDSSKYNPNHVDIPTRLTITNQADSKGDLVVIDRKVKLENNYVEKSNVFSVSTGSGSTIPIDLKNDSNRLAYKEEILLSSTSDVLYRIDSDKGGIPTDDIIVSTTSYEDPKAFGTGEKVTMDTAAPLEYPSSNLVAKSDFDVPFSPTAVFSSSVNQPGVSSAFVDTFDLSTNQDWTQYPGSPPPTFGIPGGGVMFNVSGGAQLYLNTTNTNSDLDLRATVNLSNINTNGERGIMLKKGTTDTLYAGVINYSNYTYYEEQTNADGTVGCNIATSLPHTGNLFVTHVGAAAPTVFRDDSVTCRAQHPAILVLRPVVSDKVMMRFVRTGPKVDTYFCDNEDKCDKLNYAWPLLKDTAYNVSPTDQFYPGVYEKNDPGATFSYFRVSKISGDKENPTAATPFTFSKSIDFGQQVIIKKIEMNGFVPGVKNDAGTTVPNFFVKVGDGTNTYCQPDPSENPCTKQSSLSFTPVNDTGGDIVASSLRLEVDIKAFSAELSEIPFIRSIRIFYMPKL